jgi:hypothetical protein
MSETTAANRRKIMIFRAHHLIVPKIQNAIDHKYKWAPNPADGSFCQHTTTKPAQVALKRSRHRASKPGTLGLELTRFQRTREEEQRLRGH